MKGSTRSATLDNGPPEQPRPSLSTVILRRTVGLVLGLGLTVYVLSQVRLTEIGTAMMDVGAWMIVLVLLHALSILIDAQGWEVILLRLRARVGRAYVIATAFVRNATQTLVPVGASGFVAGYRALHKQGVKTHTAVAGLIAETTLMTGAELFLLVFSGLVFFASLPPAAGQHLLGFVPVIAVLSAVLLGALIAQIRGGVFDTIQRKILRLSPSPRRAMWRKLPLRIKRDLFRVYRRPRVLLVVLFWQTSSLLAGSISLWLIFVLARHPVPFSVAVLFLCLMRAVRSFGFLVPSAWGLQEGLFVVLAPLAGVPVAIGLAASLILRVRDFVFAFTFGPASHLALRRATVSSSAPQPARVSCPARTTTES